MIVVAICRGGADLSIEVRPRLKSGLRRSPGGTVLMSEVEPGSRRSPGGAVLMSEVEPGSRRSPGGAALADVVEARLP